jgi:hypothetical protein
MSARPPPLERTMYARELKEKEVYFFETVFPGCAWSTLSPKNCLSVKLLLLI